MQKKNLVVKDNALINASYRLSLAEQRIVLLSILNARESNIKIDEKTPLEIHADTYAKNFKVDLKTAYEAIKEAAETLMTRAFSFDVIDKKGSVRHATSSWVQYIDYSHGLGAVRLIFATKVVPLVTRLEKHFTSYELEQVSGLTSVYAIRLYELLMTWKSAGKTPMYELADFREKIGVEEGRHTLMSNFKSRVLDFAINQINKNTDLTVKYEQHKAGRVIKGFSFKFEFKKPAIDVDSTRCDKTGELGLNEPLTPQQIGYYAKLLGQSSWANHAKILQGVESKDVFSVIMRHLKNPEFYEKHKDKIDELKNANKAQK